MGATAGMPDVSGYGWNSIGEAPVSRGAWLPAVHDDQAVLNGAGTVVGKGGEAPPAAPCPHYMPRRHVA